MNFIKSLFARKHDAPSLEDLNARLLESTNQMLMSPNK